MYSLTTMHEHQTFTLSDHLYLNSSAAMLFNATVCYLMSRLIQPWKIVNGHFKVHSVTTWKLFQFSNPLFS